MHFAPEDKPLNRSSASGMNTPTNIMFGLKTSPTCRDRFGCIGSVTEPDARSFAGAALCSRRRFDNVMDVPTFNRTVPDLSKSPGRCELFAVILNNDHTAR